MKRSILYLSLLLLVFLAAAMPAAAQKAPADPRPLHGLDRERVAPQASLGVAGSRGTPAALRAGATVVDRAALTMRPVSSGTAERAAAASVAWTPDALRLQLADNGTVRWLEGPLGRPDLGAGKRQAVSSAAALALLQRYAGLLRLDDPAAELRPMDLSADRLGYVHARFEQTYRGLPVWGRDLYVHFDADGEVYAVNGTYEPTPAGVATTPALGAEAARRVAVEDLQAEGRWAPLPDEAARRLGLDGVETRLVLYPDAARGVRLAYEVTLHPNLMERYTYLVDAADGTVLNRIARHCTFLYDPVAHPPPDVPMLHPPPAAVAGAGTFLDATATDLNGQTQSLRVYRHDDGLHYLIWDLPNLDPARSSLPGDPSGGAVTLTAQNTDAGANDPLAFVRSPNNAWTDPSAVSAHVNARVTYDYFRDTFARSAIDDRDSPILAVIHITRGGQPMDNAFWNGRYMAYGDGAVFKPFAGALDIATHEMSHGVVEHTAGLVYQFQSGALNESFADVFGAMVDREDLLMGEDIMKPGTGVAGRDMLNPDNPQVLQPQPAHMEAYQEMSLQVDDGGVHINSGIPNRAAALVVQAVGHDATEQIYYRALTHYLTRSSQFVDARNALEQSAADLFGAEGAQVAAVRAAFDAVGITADPGGERPETDVPPVAVERSLITFLREDGRIGLVDVTDPSDVRIGVFESPRAVARVDGEDRAQLSTPRGGARVWFVDRERRLAFLDVRTGEVSVFEDLYLQQPGDLWNASVAPDEAYVALTSAYQDDPTLYFFDGSSEIRALPLEPESTQEGIPVETIRYPDVVSWSPDAAVPKIAFDAYNEVPVGTSAIGYWSMYEIDFAASRIYNLIPAQPSEISVGNVTLGNTDPDLVAFNVLDGEGTADVFVGNFDTGGFDQLEVPSFTRDGVPISDGLRPTFSPDDATLAFASAAHRALFFYDSAERSLSFVDLQAAVYNPRWFALGTPRGVDVAEADELPDRVALHANYPNPFNPSTLLRFDLSGPADVLLEVFDVLGRRVALMVDGSLPGGTHEVRFDGRDLPSGTYLVRLRAGEEAYVRPVVLLR